MNPYNRLPKVPLLAGRQEFVLAKCRGKRVLHLGCVDAGLLGDRFERGELMHQKLATVASALWGVDIDAEGIAFLRDKGFTNLAVGDICEPATLRAFHGQEFDICLASEVIEHLQNPGLFLEAVKSLMTPGVTELVVSVPNAFRVESLLWLWRGVEYVHPDHNYWFSYQTITNLVRKSGFEISEVYAYTFQPHSVFPRQLSSGSARQAQSQKPGERTEPAGSPVLSLWRRGFGYVRTLPRRMATAILYRRTPFWGDGIIVVARIAHGG